MTDETWRDKLHEWANQFTAQLAQRPGVLGVMIGGSLARGQEWRHSDLETGILVESKDESLPYFNVHEGRGVEIIQLIRPDLVTQLDQIAAGDLSPVADWRIQLWEGRLVHDPTGLLAQFKTQFDRHLFSDVVLGQRQAELGKLIDARLAAARQLLGEDRPVAALVELRQAMNHLILVAHWARRELPRSQNRTDSRLRSLCQRHDIMPFYDLYRDVFGLADTQAVIADVWPAVRDQVLEITRLWGDSARDFFDHAVDSQFLWGEDAGILTVYRLYVPIIGGEDRAIQSKLDDSEWQTTNHNLLQFLGLAEIRARRVSEQMAELERWREQLADGT